MTLYVNSASDRPLHNYNSKFEPYIFSCSFIECPDYNDQCPYWAASGECSKNPSYMLYSCMKSCNVDCTPGKKFGYHKTVI